MFDCILRNFAYDGWTPLPHCWLRLAVLAVELVSVNCLLRMCRFELMCLLCSETEDVAMEPVAMEPVAKETDKRE